MHFSCQDVYALVHVHFLKFWEYSSELSIIFAMQANQVKHH